MADEIIVFTLHRAITIPVPKSAPEPRPVSSRIRTRPRFHPIRDYDQIDSQSDFVVVRELSETDAAVQRRVEELRFEAAVQRRVEQLRWLRRSD
jgi:hypothetical protein